MWRHATKRSNDRRSGGDVHTATAAAGQASVRQDRGRNAGNAASVTVAGAVGWHNYTFAGTRAAGAALLA